MKFIETDRNRNPWAALREFTRPRSISEHCELCSLELSPEHQHLIEPTSRKILCACEACALLFSDGEDQKYRRVPQRIGELEDFQMSEQQWNSLAIPIGLAFFFYSSTVEKMVAIYPSPAGPTESLLELDCWTELATENPVLQQMEPDTEALMLNRVGTSRLQYLVPIDECYKLVGLIRLYWQGLSGGAKVWERIDAYFSSLNSRARGTQYDKSCA